MWHDASLPWSTGCDREIAGSFSDGKKYVKQSIIAKSSDMNYHSTTSC